MFLHTQPGFFIMVPYEKSYYDGQWLCKKTVVWAGISDCRQWLISVTTVAQTCKIHQKTHDPVFFINSGQANGGLICGVLRMCWAHGQINLLGGTRATNLLFDTFNSSSTFLPSVCLCLSPVQATVLWWYNALFRICAMWAHFKQKYMFF